jgi:crotonobetainyl-CoA:carnitine CoA-transferase CaiB-like acyl-CoA transferase
VDGAVFDGFKVLEVGTWVMVPAAATVLADFGAEVVKVEHPRRGDPSRGLVTGGVNPQLGAVNIMMEQINRGKRSVGLDISVPEGREVLYRLAASSDVFMTSLLPAARQKLGLGVEQIREHNPQIVYVRADAVGGQGPEAGKPGYDSAVFFGRGGILDSLSGRNAELAPPRPGFGDKTASMNIAFGVAAALLKRVRSGVTSIVDVSLLSAAMWVASSDITYSGALGADFTRQERRATTRSPASTGRLMVGGSRWRCWSRTGGGRTCADISAATTSNTMVDSSTRPHAPGMRRHASSNCRQCLPVSRSMSGVVGSRPCKPLGRSCRTRWSY